MGKAEGETLRLPETRVFSIAVPKVTKEAGLDGVAEADAQADNGGSANVRAAVTNSGTALGSFQLGHAFENDTQRQVDFDFAVHFHYAFQASATPPTPYPDAQVGLKLYARDDHGRLLHDLTVAQHSTENGPASAESDDNQRFTLTLGPGEAVSVFLAGQAKVEVKNGRSARGSLTLTGLRMEVVTRPAPALESSGDGQE